MPPYFPPAEPVDFLGKKILVIWVPGGDNRPYKAPESLGKKPAMAYWVRRYSSTKKANPAEERQLFELAAKVPFDDRVNHQALIADFNVPLIGSFLQEVKSDLSGQLGTMPLNDLCKQMNIVRGSKEDLKPINVGVLFFSEHPERYFPGAKVEIVEYRDDIGDDFSEKVFTGPIHRQLTEALQYLKTNVLKEEIRKISGKAKAQRFSNYPYEAVEESLANAIYHRSYEDQNPIEVSVWRDRIEILSYPGPLPPVDNKQLKKPRIVARYYRNRRVGDFLKELGLTEGRGTGIPKIRNALKGNGSPPPKFRTDRNKTHFLTTLPIHPYARLRQVVVPRGKEIQLNETDKRILKACLKRPLAAFNIAKILGYPTVTRNMRISLRKLLTSQYLVYSIPEKPNSRNQTYIITESGKHAVAKS